MSISLTAFGILVLIATMGHAQWFSPEEQQQLKKLAIGERISIRHSSDGCNSCQCTYVKVERNSVMEGGCSCTLVHCPTVLPIHMEIENVQVPHFPSGLTREEPVRKQKE
jgi:hypothetical protein